MTDDRSLTGEAEGLGLESVSVSEHSENAQRLFRGGSECSDIEDMEGLEERGGETEGEGERERQCPVREDSARPDSVRIPKKDWLAEILLRTQLLVFLKRGY